MSDSKSQPKNIMAIAGVALMGIIAILLGVIAFKGPSPATTPEAAPAPAVQTAMLSPQSQVSESQVSELQVSEPQPAVPTPTPAAQQPPKKITTEDVAKFIIQASNNGRDDNLNSVMSELTPDQYSIVVLEVDHQDAGMGAGFLDWQYRNNHKSKAAAAYSGFPIEYKAKLIEVYTRNKMDEIAKFLYTSVDLPAQQQIRKQLRKDYAKTYTTIMRSIVQ